MEEAMVNSGKKIRLKFPKKINLKKWIKILIALILVVAIVLVGINLFASNQSSQVNAAVRTATVEKKTIQSALSSSGTLEALNTYSITALVSGEVITAEFEEGDQVEKGDVLYKIDTDSIDSKINSAQTSLERAQQKYEDAQKDYDKAAKQYTTLNYASTIEGYIKTLYVEAGDEIQSGAKIADLYNDKTMVLKVPFLSSLAAKISVGDTAAVTIVESGEKLSGTVTAVNSMEQTLTGGSIVRMVSVEVQNPGALSTESTAAAVINSMTCSADGSFTAQLEKTLTADRGGEIDKLSVAEGDYVKNGGTLFTLTSESVEEQLKNVTNSLDNAKQSLEDAQTGLENQQDTLADYEITAPISGQVIVKNVKAGDTLNNSNSNANALAVIYDMSALTFQMSVDELDVLNVKVGQTVEVTADAIEGETFTGSVTTVSLESSSSNGVTNYPVTVRLDDTGDLLPGMNVDAKIIIDEATDVLAIPAEALQRGDTVYVQDDSVKEADGKVPAGFKSVQVETGLISSDYVEIKSGLSEGDVVYINPTTSTGTTAMQMGPGMQGGMPSGGMPSGGAPTGGSNNRGTGTGGGFSR